MLNISFTIITVIGLSFSLWALFKFLNTNSNDRQRQPHKH